MKRIRELLAEVLAGLEGNSAEVIAYEAGVSVTLVRALRSGKHTNPSVEVIEALQQWIEINEGESHE